MSDLIRRQATIIALANNRCGNDEWDLAVTHDVETVKRIPSVEPERKVGHWIIHPDDLFPAESTQECSECHEHQPLDWRCSDNYCPNCGVKMLIPGSHNMESEDE